MCHMNCDVTCTPATSALTCVCFASIRQQGDLADTDHTMLMMTQPAYTAQHTLGRGRPRVSVPAVRRGMPPCTPLLKPWRSVGPARPHSAAIGTTHCAVMTPRC